MITVAVSGGFDPVHGGHIDLFNEAKKLGDKLIVILNTDDFLRRKKGFSFMTWDERAKIISNLKAVDRVVKCIDSDDTVCETLKWIKPDIFANGGDRHKQNTPEDATCKELGIRAVYGIGGKKTQSSSELIKKVQK